MGIVNRRNAILGWTVWQFGKKLARHKARDAVPKIDREARRPNKPAIAAALLGFGAVLLFWRKKSAGDDTESTEP